ncbi:MAG: hypothetical protein HYW07_22600 [Candidatus Latescibacteria bacterium]|nr:hypothetical protein [Candidatus Latescibacterota bacterium]
MPGGGVKELLKELSIRLTDEFGRGFSEDNLSNMRRFFLTWRLMYIYGKANGDPHPDMRECK